MVHHLKHGRQPAEQRESKGRQQEGSEAVAHEGEPVRNARVLREAEGRGGAVRQPIPVAEHAELLGGKEKEQGGWGEADDNSNEGLKVRGNDKATGDTNGEAQQVTATL